MLRRYTYSEVLELSHAILRHSSTRKLSEFSQKRKFTIYLQREVPVEGSDCEDYNYENKKLAKTCWYDHSLETQLQRGNHATPCRRREGSLSAVDISFQYCGAFRFRGKRAGFFKREVAHASATQIISPAPVSSVIPANGTHSVASGRGFGLLFAGSVEKAVITVRAIVSSNSPMT